MKKLFIIILFIISTGFSFSQNSKNTSAVDAYIIYPLTSDKKIEELNRAHIIQYFAYPLLIVNNIIIREEEEIDTFRNNIQYKDIRSTKMINKITAEKKGIRDVPEDGVIIVRLKQRLFWELTCLGTY